MKEPFRSQFTGSEIDQILSEAVPHVNVNPAGYKKLVSSGKVLPDVWYCVYSDAQFLELEAIYIGENLLINVKDRYEGLMKEEQLTEEEYLKLRADRKIVPGTWYSIYSDYAHKNLTAVYNGNKLILKGNDKGSSGFPYTFPITF